uniref:Replication-associated protein n=1 Tax=Turdus naumanni Genomoviridae sp. TaxID=2814955 RepID=A0A8A4XDE1_9VIRU
MPRAFKFIGEHVLLTFAQSPDLDPEEVVALIRRLGGECIIGRENHADGGIHFHCFVQFKHEFITTDARAFDVGGRHPNVRKMYRTPEKGYDYAIKDGDVVGGTLERPSPREGRSGVGGSSDKWTEIIASETREEFFEAAARLDPKSLCCSFNSLSKYADWKYRVERGPYSTPRGVSIITEGVSGLDDWATTLTSVVYFALMSQSVTAITPYSMTCRVDSNSFTATSFGWGVSHNFTRLISTRVRN